MKYILSLFIAFSVNAQEGTGFQEVDPAKDAVLLRKIEAEKLLKMMAVKKKAEALKNEKIRKEDERIAAEEKKKKEAEDYTRWLIAERDRKMKEAAEAKKQSPQTRAEGLDWNSRKPRQQIHRIETHGTDYPVTIYPTGQCSFPEKTKIPEDVKIFGIGTYEGTFAGEKELRDHSMTDVTINIQAQGAVALVLWTYEPIRWTIKMNGANLVGILVIGYHEQKLVVDKDVPAIVSFYEHGKNQCQYSENNHDQQMDYQERANMRLSKLSLKLFGKPLTSSRYMYTLPPEVRVPSLD